MLWPWPECHGLSRHARVTHGQEAPLVQGQTRVREGHFASAPGLRRCCRRMRALRVAELVQAAEAEVDSAARRRGSGHGSCRRLRRSRRCCLAARRLLPKRYKARVISFECTSGMTWQRSCRSFRRLCRCRTAARGPHWIALNVCDCRNVDGCRHIFKVLHGMAAGAACAARAAVACTCCVAYGKHPMSLVPRLQLPHPWQQQAGLQCSSAAACMGQSQGLHGSFRYLCRSFCCHMARSV